MSAGAAVQDVLQRLAMAAPVAWRQDRVFRGALIGAGIALAMLYLRPETSGRDVRSPPPAPASAMLPAVPGPTGSGTMPGAPIPPTEVPKIAPGQPLGTATVIPVPNGDRFGTIKPGKAP